MRYLVAIAAGMLMAPVIAAADEVLAVAGAGASSCGKFIADTEGTETMSLIYFSWAQGFLTGLNAKYVKSRDSTDLSDRDALELFIENYCEENPLDNYVRAAAKLWHELRARQELEPDIRGARKD